MALLFQGVEASGFVLRNVYSSLPTTATSSTPIDPGNGVEMGKPTKTEGLVEIGPKQA